MLYLVFECFIYILSNHICNGLFFNLNVGCIFSGERLSPGIQRWLVAGQVRVSPSPTWAGAFSTWWQPAEMWVCWRRQRDLRKSTPRGSIPTPSSAAEEAEVAPPLRSQGIFRFSRHSLSFFSFYSDDPCLSSEPFFVNIYNI